MKRIQAIALLLAGMLLVAGCQSAPAAPQQAAMREVKDSKGSIVRLLQKPQRIVSVSIATDEILLELIAPERIAALTYWADDAGISNVTEKAKMVKSRARANAETIIALQPDLVLVPDWQPVELSQILRDSGLPVYVFQSARTVEQVKENIRDVAALVGEPAKGTALIQQMDTELAAVADKVKTVPETERKTVARYAQLGGSGGTGSTFDDLCRYAGVRNAAALAGLDLNGTLTKEQLIQINPDILLLPAWDYGGKTDLNQFRQEVQQDPALQTVKAIRTEKLLQVADRYIFCTSHNIVQGAKEIAKAAYPQLFP